MRAVVIGLSPYSGFTCLAVPVLLRWSLGYVGIFSHFHFPASISSMLNFQKDLKVGTVDDWMVVNDESDGGAN